MDGLMDGEFESISSLFAIDGSADGLSASADSGTVGLFDGDRDGVTDGVSESNVEGGVDEEGAVDDEGLVEPVGTSAPMGSEGLVDADGVTTSSSSCSSDDFLLLLDDFFELLLLSDLLDFLLELNCRFRMASLKVGRLLALGRETPLLLACAVCCSSGSSSRYDSSVFNSPFVSSCACTEVLRSSMAYSKLLVDFTMVQFVVSCQYPTRFGVVSKTNTI